MKIFVTGASGTVGFAVASRLAANGHQVSGLVRSNEKAKKIAAAEILPIFGSMDDPSSYKDSIRSCEILIHCAAEWSDYFHELDRKTVDSLIKVASESKHPRKIIYTSGVWLYGNTGYSVVDETSDLKPMKLVMPRFETEKYLLNANKGQLKTVSIRPGCVYGGAGSLTSSWFESATKEGKARYVGTGENRWAMVHIQDLADIYRRVAESMFGGQIFNATDRSRFTILECAKAASRAAGCQEQVHAMSVDEAAKTLGLMAECLALDQYVDSSKAERLLKWQPRHGGFVDGVEKYFAAWKASVE